jgi:hypothetical protein
VGLNRDRFFNLNNSENFDILGTSMKSFESGESVIDAKKVFKKTSRRTSTNADLMYVWNFLGNNSVYKR